MQLLGQLRRLERMLKTTNNQSMQSLLSFSSVTAGQNYRDFAEASPQIPARWRPRFRVDSRILLSALGAALNHHKPADPTFKMGQCLSAFPSLFQILELKVPGN